MKNTSAFFSFLTIFFCISFFLFCSPATQPELNEPSDISGEITSQGVGCSNFMLCKSNSLKSKWIILEANLDSLAISTEFKTFSINTSSSRLTVHYDYYSINKDSTKQNNFMYCNDVFEANAQRPEIWMASDGFADLKRSEIDTSGFFNEYSVTVRLRNIHFVNSLNADTLFLKELYFDTIRVGGLSG